MLIEILALKGSKEEGRWHADVNTKKICKNPFSIQLYIQLQKRPVRFATTVKSLGWDNLFQCVWFYGSSKEMGFLI